MFRRSALTLVLGLAFVACTKSSEAPDAGPAKRTARASAPAGMSAPPAPTPAASNHLQVVLDHRADLAARKAALEGLVKEGDPAVVYPLIATLQGEDPLKADVQHTLEVLKAGTRLAEDIDNGDLAMKQRATLAAFFIKDTVLTEALIDALADPDVVVRTQVASALRAAGDPRAVEPLIGRLTTDPEADVRIAIAQALHALGGPGAKAALEKAGTTEQDEYAKGVIQRLVNPR